MRRRARSFPAPGERCYGTPALSAEHDPSSVALVGTQYIPRVSLLRDAARSPENIRLPQDAPYCSVRRGVSLAEGSHAFVVVPGERRLRVSPHTADFGTASGHPHLANERPVIFAGELVVSASGRLLAWSNVSGTYTPPRRLAAQVDLPLELLWVLLRADEVAAEVGAADAGVGASGAAGLAATRVSTERLDTRFGAGNHLRLTTGDVLVRDVARCPPQERQPLPRGSWRPVQGAIGLAGAPRSMAGPLPSRLQAPRRLPGCQSL
mmetsp:Transcript_4364/g.11313  ORF Transcript_4364/g.11313 Transcript_4364/m.11313 type:complete len:265 (-) Transcript_4364:77-871(-)